MIRYLLFPGRHHLLTRFQARYLSDVLAGERALLDGTAPEVSAEAEVIFAVTSADHGNTRRNPISGSRREAQIELFRAAEGLRARTYLIDDVPETGRFASYMLSAIAAAGGPELTAANSALVCSTPAVYEQFKELGFRVFGCELDEEPAPARPWDVLEMSLSEKTLPEAAELMHPVSKEFLDRYRLIEQARRLHADPLLSGEGELTETRDYISYQEAFDRGAGRKWKLLGEHVRSGRIVDLGSGAGSLLAEAASDPRLAESDLYGIEAARPLYEESLHRRRQGAFENPNTFFYQRNFLAGELFRTSSVDTFITAALCHELYSYLGRDELLRGLELFHSQLVTGGRWLNLDVCGPERGDQLIWLELQGPGTADDVPVSLEDLEPAERSAVLEALTPVQSFVQFAHDWAHPGTPGLVEYRLLEQEGSTLVECRLRVAMEWLTKKDYFKSWLSEMHESFCFWSFADWCEAARGAGFRIRPESRSFRNEWLVKNRFEPVARLHPVGEPAQVLPWPDTHLMMVAEKPPH